MNFLQQLIESADTKIQKSGFDVIGQIISEMREVALNPLNEGFTDNHRGDLEKQFDKVEEKFIAARRMLAKLNSANLPPEQKSEHKSKVMKYINAFRKELIQLMDEMGMSSRERQYHVDRMGLDREFGKPAETFTRGSENKDMSRFKDMVNKQRNLADPEDIKRRPAMTANKPKRWYNRLFAA